MQGRLQEWPPILPRLPVVRAQWSFTSNVMIWDLDGCPCGQRIAAASSDCNVYILDLDGNICTRLELPSQVTRVRFLGEGLLIANGRAGSVYGLRLTHGTGSAEHLDVEFELPLDQAPTDIYGVVTGFSVDDVSSAILVSYGNATSGIGGIACIDFSGHVSWRRALEGAVLGIAASGGSTLQKSGGTVGVGTAMTSNGDFRAFSIGADGSIKCIVERAAVIRIIGVSATSGAVLLGLTYDKQRFELVRLNSEGIGQDTLATEAFPISGLLLENDTLLVAAITPLQGNASGSSCGVSAWVNGVRRWTRPMVRQVFRLTFDPILRLFFVSSLGQGNVYALSIDGTPVACAKVELAPVCFHIHEPSGLLLVGSKCITAFRREAFAR